MNHWIAKINSSNITDYHPELEETFFSLASHTLQDFPHIILFGSNGSRKHTVALRILYSHSASKLVYKRRLLVQNKVDCYVDISDIHAEIDFETFACTKKTEWTEAYCAIVRAARAGNGQHFFIVCLNTQCISKELLKTMYAYMQGLEGLSIKFIFSTNNYTGLPCTLTSRCLRINVKHPPKSMLPKSSKRPSQGGFDVSKEAISLIEYGKDGSIGNLRASIYNLLEKRYTCSDIIFELLKVESAQREITSEEIFFIIETLSRLETTRRKIYHLEHLVLKITDRNESS